MVHENKEQFDGLLDYVSVLSGVKKEILEKDYYVCLLLSELSEDEARRPCVFKGGTALYKRLHSTNRWSEDIDLSVPIEDLATRSQQAKRLKSVALGLKSAALDKEDADYQDRKGSILAVYRYEPVNGDTRDELGRLGKVKIEATSFGTSEPSEEQQVTTILEDYIGNDLAREYRLPSFTIKTSTIERICADKIFAAESYYRKKDYFAAAKHVYDLCIIASTSLIECQPTRHEVINQAFLYRRIEELHRIDSNLIDIDFSHAQVLNCFNDAAFLNAFMEMQEIYVTNKESLLGENDLISGLDLIEDLGEIDKSYDNPSFLTAKNEAALNHQLRTDSELVDLANTPVYSTREYGAMAKEAIDAMDPKPRSHDDGPVR